MKVKRKPISFQLSADLIRRMKIEAAKENRCLNEYVEEILRNAVYYKPNKITLAAIQEAESGKELEVLDLENLKEYISSL